MANPVIQVSVMPEALTDVLRDDFAAEAARLIALHKAAPELAAALRAYMDAAHGNHDAEDREDLFDAAKALADAVLAKVSA
jgi:hypothetical protein